MGGKKPETMGKKQRENLLTKLAHFVGMILQMLAVALPKDIFRWLFLSRKCVRGQTIVITGGASGIVKLSFKFFIFIESIQRANGWQKCSPIQPDWALKWPSLIAIWFGLNGFC